MLPRTPGCRAFPLGLGSFGRLWAGLFLLLMLSGDAAAQEVKWRYDYNTARKEAEEKNRPLFIDFGTVNCFWCKRLDMTTFQDGTIIALLNDRFIPIKIDADRDTALAQALNINSYPTIVMASTDGKILGTVVGYKAANEFQEIMQRTLAVATKPSTVTGPDPLVKAFEEAAKAVEAGEIAQAIPKLKAILDQGKDRPVEGKARQLLQNLEQQAMARLQRARQFDDKGQTPEAVDALNELIRLYPGTTAAGDAARVLPTLTARQDQKQQHRIKRARELLTQAREDFRSQQHMWCLDRCELLAAHYADLPEGSEAIQLAGEIKNNPELMRLACDNLSDRLGLLYLSLAETLLRKGQPDQAVQYLERVIQAFPGSRQAEAAQIRLAFLKGQSTLQAEVKKQ